MRFPAALKYIAGAAFLLGMAARPGLAQIIATINYADNINSNGTPLIFGGSNEPNPGDQASFYPQATTSGVKFERGSIHVDQVVPTSTVSAFLAAMTGGSGGSYVSGSVADPSTWNWGPTTWASYAHGQGWTTMANLLNCPTWLAYSGTTGGIPSNWAVWQYIVKAIVVHEGSNLNYLEVLNETQYEISLTGSPYTTLQSAVNAYYFEGATGARAGSSSLKIGGDADATTNFNTLPGLIEDTGISSNLLQFVSYHVYSSNPVTGDNIASLASTLSNNGRGGLPIFLTEWNYTIGANCNCIDDGNETVNFTAQMLMEMTGQTQLSGAAFFSFLPNNEVISGYEDCGCSNYPFAFYSGTNDVATLLPVARAWRLLSADLGLGAGTYHTFGTVGATVPLEGWVNSGGGVVAAVSNESASATTINFTLEGIDTSGCNFGVNVYVADTGSNTAVNPVKTYTNQCITNKTLTLTGVAAPAYSVVGISVY